MKENFKKIRGKVENLDVKNTVVAPFVQEKNQLNNKINI